MSQSDPVLLIHGAWQGSWSWDKLVPLLEASGLATIAVDLPGNGADGTDPAAVTLDACLDYLDKLVAPFDRVSVVGHSGGGLIGSAFAERNARVVRMAYVAGMMLPAGRSFAEVRAEGLGDSDAMPGIAPHLVWSSDGRVSTVPAFAAEAIFFNDCPADAASAASQRLTPQGEGARSITLASERRVTALPRLYVEATEDMSLPIAVQRRMQSLLPGALIAELPTGHAPQLSAPRLLADQLLPFLTGQRDSEAMLQRNAATIFPTPSNNLNGDQNEDDQRASYSCRLACNGRSGPCPGSC